jgi:predicted HTH transcriptional regulator
MAALVSSMKERSQIPHSDNLHVSISDEELILKLTDAENNFIGRKRAPDKDDWLKTAVAVANSCPIGFPGVLYIGVNDDGTVQRAQKAVKFEDLQKSVSSVIAHAWPPIYIVVKTLKKNGAEFAAVLIPGGHLRPHFSGQPYVRVGPERERRVSRSSRS